MTDNGDNVKKAMLEKINRLPKSITIPIEDNDAMWNDIGQKYYAEHRLSSGDCRKCVLEITKAVYFEFLKQSFRK